MYFTKLVIMKRIAIIALLLLTSLSALTAQEKNTVLNRPLKYIKYMSVNARLGYGIGKPSMAIKNNWTVRASLVTYFGLGYNFVIKNNWGFDLQINEELGKFTYGNEGPEFKSGYMTTGAELGIKKIIFKKPDDTFFARIGIGYNFLVAAADAGSNEYYSYATTPNGSNIYLFPELGYQFRFPSGNHILDLSAGYKYSLTPVANTYMVFTDKGTMFEENTSKMSGSFIGINLRYSFLFKGFEKRDQTKRKVEEQF